MLHRDENGVYVSADKLSDITNELKKIEGEIETAAKKGKENLTDDEKAAAVQSAADLEALLKLFEPELKKQTNPIALMGFVKQLLRLKSLAEKLHGIRDSEEND